MNYQELLKKSKHYWPVITLENKFGHKKRKPLRIVLGLLIIVTLIGFGILIIDPNWVNNAALNAIQLEIIPYVYLLRPTLSISLLLWFILFTLDAFYYSHLFDGLPTTLREHKNNGTIISYEVAEILLHDRTNPTRALLLSQVGREILIRSGFPLEAIGKIKSSLHLESIEWPEDQTYTVQRFVRIITEHDEGFMRSLFQSGVRTADLLGSALWVTNRIHKNKKNLRKWGREKLGRIPGIAKDWAYGSVYYLDKYARKIEYTSEYNGIEPNSKRNLKESREIEAILSRGRESNVLLVGKDGTGKLSIVAKVAKEISQGNIFPQLEHKHIYVLDGQAIISAGDGKNSFEQNLRLVMNESVKAGNIILVMPDLDAVIKSAQSVGSNLISLLDPYLTSSSLQIIGITTEQSYFGMMERIPRIIQRFDKVTISTTDRNSTLEVVMDYAADIEHRKGLIFTYPSLARLVDNTDRYITSGVMPDKALDILLEFSSLLSSKGARLISEKIVDQFFREKTNIPVGEIDSGERETLLRLEKILHTRVIGQDEAVKAISTTMRRARAGIQNPDRPIGSFLFLGPTGVGKTEVSKALSAAFFGNEEAMMRFDMSEYKTLDSLDKLIGSFQTGKSGTLSRALKQKPYGLLLLDEFEKSNEQVKDLFLQILDEGKFSDMNSNIINAQSTIIIATSNAGADIIWDLFQEGKNPALFKQDLINRIIEQGIYKPELLNRFDGIVVFHPLTSSNLHRIASLMLNKLSKRILQNKGIEVLFNEDMIDVIATKGSNPQFGARPMNRYIQENIEQIIADRIITDNTQPGSQLRLSASDLN